MLVRRDVWLVVDHSGDYEDSLSRPVVAFDREERARACAAKRKERHGREWEEDYPCGYLRSEVVRVPLVTEEGA